jgi:hypothetical protein
LAAAAAAATAARLWGLCEDKAIAETLNTRVTWLEKIVAELGKAQLKTENALSHFVEIQAQAQTEARERERRIDERIEKLVIAIGELIQHLPRNGRPGA